MYGIVCMYNCIHYIIYIIINAIVNTYNSDAHYYYYTYRKNLCAHEPRYDKLEITVPI